jgi:hypothetical protein
MRSIPVLTFVLTCSVVAAACSSSTTTLPGEPLADASTDGARADGSTSDAALADSSTGTDSATDGGACVLMGGVYDKTCVTAADCLMVARGCFCGAQPIIGVAKSAQPAAQACESQAEKSCALGCANAPGHVGEDGQNDEGTGRNLEVLCDLGKCHTALMP